MILAVIRKEIRTYGHYALLAGVVLAAALAWLLYDRRDYGMSVVEDRFMTTTMIAFAAGAFVLGFTSVMLDRRRGHWAFAVHRPASRWTLYFGKLIGLGVIYGVAAMIALGVVAACAADLHFTHTPFAASMLRPMIFTQAAGVVWLIAGTLVAARDAGWIGTRLFPTVIAAVTVVAGVNLTTTPIGAGTYLALGAIVLTVAAAAHFVHNGAYALQPWWAKPATFVVALAGAIVVLATGLNLLAAALRPPVKYIAPTTQPTTRREYAIGPDGQPYIFGFVDTEHHYARVSDTYTLQGVPLTPDDAEWVRENRPPTVEINAGDRTRTWQSFLRAGANLERIGSPGILENWWYVPARRQLEGYRPDGELIGTIGADGFHHPGEATAPFPGGYTEILSSGSSNNDWTAVLHTDTHAYFIDFTLRTTIDAFQTDGVEGIIGLAPSFRPFVDARGKRIDGAVVRVLQIITRSAVHIVPLDGSPAASVPIDPIDGYARYSVALLNGGGAAVLGDISRSSNDRRLTRLRDGRVERITLPAFPSPPYDIIDMTTYAEYVRLLPNIFGMPPLWSAWGWTRAWYAGFMTDAWWRAWFWKTVGMTFVVPIVVGVMTTASAVRGRGFSQRRKIGWMAAAVLFGPVAAVTLLCLHSRPVRVPCPACGRKRLIAADRCPHCAATWPVPGNAATDVFEPQRMAAA